MDLKQIYYDLGNAVKGICDVVIARNRPYTVDKRYDSFIVVSLPYTIRNNEISDDGSYNDYSTRSLSGCCPSSPSVPPG